MLCFNSVVNRSKLLDSQLYVHRLITSHLLMLAVVFVLREFVAVFTSTPLVVGRSSGCW